jgi:Ca2+-binding RTX toxin-like protein
MRSLVLAVVAAVLTAVPAHAADGETCQGKPVTIVGQIGTTHGTEGDDVILLETDRSSLSEVDAKGGDDTICVTGPLPVDRGPEDIASFVDGGPGVDSLEVVASDEEDDLEVYDTEYVDLSMLGAGDRAVVFDVASDTSIDGGAGPDRLRVLFGSGAGDRQRCMVDLAGGGGADLLAVSFSGDVCVRGGARLRGQHGDDVLRGSSLGDRILGGKGRDGANGRAGNDLCVAEKEEACER